LQQVPISVTALATRDIERRQLRDVQSLQYAVPSLAVFPVVANSTTAVIGLRGLGEFDPLPTNDPAVGIYLDGVYIARATGANMDLVDLERVEVLRGPQGTLFGRNTIGGAVNLVPIKPGPVLEGSLETLFGNYDRLDVTGVLNLPLSERGAAARLAIQHTAHSGYGRAVLLGKDVSDDDTDYVRAQLRWLPHEDWTVDLSGDLTDVDTGAQLMTFIAGNEDTNNVPGFAGHPEDDLSNYASVDDGRVYANVAGSFESRVWGTSAIVTGALSGMTVKSITAWRELSADIEDSDFDGTPYDINTLRHRAQDERQFSQEFQAHANAVGGWVDWTAGLLYFEENADFNGENIVQSPPNETFNLVRGEADNQAWAVYGQATGELTSTLRVTAGLRYNEDRRRLISRNATREADVESCRLDPSIQDSGQDCRATLPWRSFSYWPFTVGLDYTPAEAVLLYATVSGGDRAGGYNMRGGTPTDLLAFEPERVTSYEIGAKSDFLAHRLRVNLALFHVDYVDMQVGQIVPDPIQDSTFVKQNAARAHMDGGELEITALLGPARLSGSVGLADGRIAALEPGVDLEIGDQIATPTTTYSLALDFPMQVGPGELNLHADYDGHDDDMALPSGLPRNSTALLNVIVLYRLAHGFEFGIWGRNLTNETYMAQAVDFGYLVNQIPGDPRTFGGSIAYRFGSH
jgi:iron complex outermembrane recepter protein